VLPPRLAPRGNLSKVGQHRAVKRLQTPQLGRCKLLGQLQRLELLQGAADTAQLVLQLDCRWRQRRLALGFRPQASDRIVEQLLAIGVVGHLIGVHEHSRFALFESVLLYGLEHRVLLLFT